MARHWQRWIENGGRAGTESNPYYVYLVAAEGGGIRAAYWTASVLGRLQDRDPTFAAHVYAISGVSGGSLGAAVFDALVASDLERGGCRTPGGRSSQSYVECAHAMLGDDFLAPAVASMLYPDLVQRFLPWPWQYLDRGRTLEEAWEGAWDRTMPARPGAAGFGASLDALWAGDRRYKVPSLILNSTHVETGKRVLLSNVPIRAAEFADVFDLRSEWSATGGRTAPIDMPLSTAAHGSARFTYVSPAGRLAPDFHIVDGGYFENSGSASLLEVLRVIGDYADEHPGLHLVPVVIHISNDPGVEAIYRTRCVEDAAEFGRDGGKPIRMGSETLAPIVTLLHTRDARAVNATQAIAREVLDDGGRFFHFGLTERSRGELPLGWSLSNAAMERMDAEAAPVSLTCEQRSASAP